MATIPIPQDATIGDHQAVPIPQGAAVGATEQEKRGTLGKLWDWANRGLVSQETLTRAIGGYTPQQLDEELRVLPDDSPIRAAVKTFVKGAALDSASVLSSVSSPLSVATAGAGVAGKLPGAVGTLARVGTSAASAGFAAKGAADVAQNARQAIAGNPEAAQAALLGGATLAGGAVGAAESAVAALSKSHTAADYLRAKAEQQYGQALNPTKERTKFVAQKRIPEMLDRGVTFNSPKELAETARAKANVINQELSDVYESLPGDRKSPTDAMVRALDDYKAQFQDRIPLTEDQLRQEIVKNGGQVPDNIVEGSNGLERVVTIDEHAANAAEAMKRVIQQYGDTISPKSMRKVRQIFDESVARAGGYEGRDLADGSLLDARKEAASAIRTQLAKDNPEIVPLNKEINFWLDVQRVAAETAKRRVGQQGGLGAKMAKHTGQAIGAGIGYEVGGATFGAAGAYVGGRVAENLTTFFQSPRWRTLSAVTKNGLADALASGDPAKIRANMNFVGAKLGLPVAAIANANDERGGTQ